MTSTPSVELIPKIRAAASKALALDPSLGEAHLDLAEAFLAEFDWAKSEQEFQKALELSPGNALVHRYYAFYLGKVGRIPEATAEVRRALDLDPISPFLATGLADALYYQRSYGEAMEQYRRALELDSNFGFALRGLGRLYVQNGNYQQGIRELLEAQKVMGDDPISEGDLGHAYAVSGKPAEALRILQVLLDRSHHGGSSALAISRIYFGLGEMDQGFKWLQKSVDQHELGLNLEAEPLYDPIRSDPRFGALIRRMNLS